MVRGSGIRAEDAVRHVDALKGVITFTEKLKTDKALLPPPMPDQIDLSLGTQRAFPHHLTHPSCKKDALFSNEDPRELYSDQKKIGEG